MIDPPIHTAIGPLARDPTASLRPFVAAGAMHGAVTLVASRNAVLSHGAIGWADLASGAPLLPDALFWIASMTKPMTGAMLAMLAAEGRIDLDDPVERHLPEYAGQQLGTAQDTPAGLLLTRPARPITIRDCLCHISGLPYMSRPEAGFVDRLSLREAALTYALTPLLFAPGTRYQYSNAGINTAARVAEAVTGEHYADLMHERLLAPLGMRDTVFVPDSAQAARLSKAYKGEPSGRLIEVPVPALSHPLTGHGRHPSPGSGYFSTATDVARFGQMLLDGGTFHGRRIMPAAAVREMTRKQTGTLQESYGLGIGIDPDGFGHGGALGTELRIAPDLGLVMVYLVQQQGYATPDGERIRTTFQAAARTLADDAAPTRLRSAGP